jgi:hypothetical protein
MPTRTSTSPALSPTQAGSPDARERQRRAAELHRRGISEPCLRPSGELPGDLQLQAARRLRVVCLVYGGVWMLALLVLSGLRLLDAPGSERVSVYWLAWAAIFTSVPFLLHGLGRSRRLSGRGFLDVAIGFYGFSVVGLMPIAIVGGPVPTAHMLWPYAWTLFFVSVVPMRLERVLWAVPGALASAPLLLWVAGTPLAAIPWPDLLLEMLVMTVLAAVSAHVVTRLGREVGQARDLGSYRLERRLGKGGMGEVWLASHERLARPAAVKLLRPEALGVQSLQEIEALRHRFEREAQSTAMLRSPHTVQLYDYGVTESGTLYYAMELLDGLTLEQLVRRHGPLPPARVCAVLLQVCESLAEAHEAGLIHRDIKPDNIMLCRLGGRTDFVKVLDFGLVKRQRSAPADLHLTLEGTVAGTPAFIAPEIMTEQGDVDARADLYSLGCVAYWLLTGRLVFDAPTPMGLALAHVSDTPVSPSYFSPQPLPPALERIVLDCLAKSPADRPASAIELAERIAATGLAEAWSPQHARRWWGPAQAPGASIGAEPTSMGHTFSGAGA